MFDFDYMPEDDPKRTAYGRYEARKEDWAYLTDEHWTWRFRHAFWWVLHNCIIHMLIGLIPCKKTMDLHDWSSQKLAGDHLD